MQCIYCILLDFVGKSEIVEDSIGRPTAADGWCMGQPRPFLHCLAWTDIKLAETGLNG